MNDNPEHTDPPKATPSLPSPSGYSNHAIHLVRTTQQINLSLSQMADQKASILMGATFLVFTIAVGQARGGSLPVSLAVLALFAFISAMCAVFAVLPSVSSPASAKLIDGVPNKLFFGYFAHMDEGLWTDSILDELRADETVFRTMLHDIYQNGQVLQPERAGAPAQEVQIPCLCPQELHGGHVPDRHHLHRRDRGGLRLRPVRPAR